MEKDKYYTPKKEAQVAYAPKDVPGITSPKKEAQPLLKNIVNVKRIPVSIIGTYRLPLVPKFAQIFGPACFGIWTEEGNDSIQFTGSPLSVASGLRGLVFTIQRDELTIIANPSLLTYSFYLQ